MSLIKSEDDLELKVYLTELGRLRLLEQGFNPSRFSLSDYDANYLANKFIDQVMVSITGVQDDNVEQISKNITINNKLIIN